MQQDDGGAGVRRSAGDRQLDAAARAAMSQHRGGWSVIAVAWRPFRAGCDLSQLHITSSSPLRSTSLGSHLPLAGQLGPVPFHTVIRAVSA